jgi:hypothetical protein
MEYFNKNRYSLRQVVIMLTIALLGIAVISYAAVNIPYTFTTGTTISSSQVNANFAALASAINGSTYGLVNTDGTIFGGSGNFTVTPPGTSGHYGVIFSPGLYSKSPTCVVSAFNYKPIYTCANGGSAPDGLDVYCYTVYAVVTALNTPALIDPVPTNQSFNFICVPN